MSTTCGWSLSVRSIMTSSFDSGMKVLNIFLDVCMSKKSLPATTHLTACNKDSTVVRELVIIISVYSNNSVLIWAINSSSILLYEEFLMKIISSARVNFWIDLLLKLFK